MVQFSEEKIKDRLQALGYPLAFINMEMSAVANMHDSLQGAFDAWIDGKESEFAFKGISVATIMERRHCDYYNALSFMSMLIKNPDMIADFLSIPHEMIRRHCGGGQVAEA